MTLYYAWAAHMRIILAAAEGPDLIADQDINTIQPIAKPSSNLRQVKGQIDTSNDWKAVWMTN